MDRVDYQSLIVQDLLNDHKENKLDLNPWYQRRSVWTRPQKAYLINTLFERKPIPALYIRHSINMEKGISVKEIVDGQQRARAVIEFCQTDSFSVRLPNSNKRKTFDQLTASEKEQFLITAIPIGYLIGASDADVIDIFARINSVSKTLNPQEKRNARFSGEFKQFAIAESVKRLNVWRNLGIFTANDIARMNEVLFISDLVYNLTNGLSDFKPTDIDKQYALNDDEYVEAGEMSARLDKIFSIILELDRSEITDSIFQRPPLLFSLMIVLDDLKPTPAKTSKALRSIDAAYLDENLSTDEIVSFRKAVASSTQRIASRKNRDKFIREFF